MTSSRSEVLSPCISECQLDEDSICLGCYRTIDEIISWRNLDKADRLKAVDAANERRLKGQNR